MPSIATYITSATTSPHSPLIKTLQSLSVLDSRVPHSRFVATVGQFIDFSEAFNLATFLGKVPNIKVPKVSVAVDKTPASNSAGRKAKAHYLQARGEMLELIVRSFTSERSTVLHGALRLPQVGDEGFNPNDDGLSAYLRFYSLYQSEMESRILQLHTRVRRQLAGQSSGLAQLAALDGKLSEILTSYNRKALRVIPSLLTKRFHCLHSLQHSQQPNQQPPAKIIAKDESALSAFLREMQSLLLAELDTRLQPTLGLIDALCAELTANAQLQSQQAHSQQLDSQTKQEEETK